MDLKDDPLIKEYIQNHNIKPNTILRLLVGLHYTVNFLTKHLKNGYSKLKKKHVSE
jgi:hypothetical protein